MAVRHGRMGSQFVYELLIDANAPENLAHIGLIDMSQLNNRPAHDYKTNLAGFGPGVAGQNRHLAAGDGTPPPPVLTNADAALVNT